MTPSSRVGIVLDYAIAGVGMVAITAIPMALCWAIVSRTERERAKHGDNREHAK